MSGFIFILNQNGEQISEHLVHKLVDSLYTKGPDRKSIHIDENIAMGHTLFKTTFEAEYDRQPVSLDGKVWIVSSARLDGRYDLVNKLGISKNIDLDKSDDSELILYAYRCWGEECVKHLIGDFAFVIWDRRNKRVFCARDQLGIRQLYYAKKNNFLIVSNSLNTITMHPLITKELSKKSMGGFLLFGNQAWLDKSITVFKDIKKLLPAHKLIYDTQNNFFEIKNYWKPSLNVEMLNYKKESEYLEHFNELFEFAVKERLRTSSIAITMSGGMDSSSIAATAMKLKNKSLNTMKLQAITAVYDRIHSDEERYYSKQVSEKIGIPIHYIVGDNYKIFNPYIMMTQPRQLFTPAYWMDIQKTILNYSRVSLGGASADNLFTFTSPFHSQKKIDLGSFFYQMIKMRFRYGQFPSIGLGIKKRLSISYDKNNTNFDDYPSWFNPEFEKSENLKDEWIRFKTEQVLNSHPINPRANHWIVSPEWSTDDMLMYPMESLPEERDPFLDVRLIEFVLSIPSLPWLYNKHLLRSTMGGMLPKSVIKRPKTPLGDIETILLMQSENKWINEWRPSKIIEEFIVLDKVKTFSKIKNNGDSYIESRPFHLENWLSHLN